MRVSDHAVPASDLSAPSREMPLFAYLQHVRHRINQRMGGCTGSMVRDKTNCPLSSMWWMGI